MEENIRNIKRNVKGIREEVENIKNKTGDSVDLEIFYHLQVINEKAWNILFNIEDIETFI